MIFFFVSSCVEKNKDKKIASVYKKNLFLTEILNAMPEQIEDSTFFVEEYTNKWIRKQILVHHAELNLDKEEILFDKQIEEYRYSLLIYAYHQQLLNHNFDTSITNNEILNYYNRYKQEFKLNQDIFKGRFVIIDKLAPNLHKFNSLFTSNNTESTYELFDYCQQFAKEYYLDIDLWQYFSIFVNKLPIQYRDIKLDYKNISFEDSNYRYFLYVSDYKKKGNVSPIHLERNRIRNVLLNKNKIKFLNKLEDELYQNGLDLEKIKIY